MIYQELNYLNYMSIAENLFLGRLPVKGGKGNRVDHKKLREESMRIHCSFLPIVRWTASRAWTFVRRC